LLDDPDRRARLGETGRKHVVARHSVKQLVESAFRLYEEVAEKGPPGTAAGR
jgi:hypothetical protein